VRGLENRTSAQSRRTSSGLAKLCCSGQDYLRGSPWFLI